MQPEKIPTSVGIIIDGNRRWAKAHSLLPWQGHEAGYKKVKEVVAWLRDAGVKDIVAYTFSTENWKRPEQEVSFLIKLIEHVLVNELDWANQEGIRLRGVGDMTKFSEQVQKLVKNAEEKTKNNSRITLGIALNYGGRAEILQAVNKLLTVRGSTSHSLVTEEEFSKLLYTKDIPDPDLILRTSGEQRLSNFLPWQSTYSELFFLPKMFPDLTKEDVTNVLAEYSARDRRRGK
ncbi:MAG: polyprenyl diphosphate synthase [Candidatus Paceibacterota bacterium]|jgi:undecaprenyl diphosphate synthase